MAPNINLEIKVIEKFIDKAKQDRYIHFVSTNKNRRKFIKILAHFRHFKWDLFEEIKGHEKQLILSTLQQNKLPNQTCYIISENSNPDTKTLELEEAINETVYSDMGTILVFGDADVIFYKG
jgi:hypothetical protein